jgi:LacI family transcriptional regulator
MAKVTIETVAKKTGVSTAAVSYVLSGKRKISKEVTERVLKAIDELNYKPSIVARNLASSKTWTVGLYMSPTKNIREDIFFSSLLAGIMDHLHIKRYQVHLYADYLDESQDDHPDLSMTQPIDGALVMNPRINDVYLDHIKKQNIPFVVIGTPSDPENIFYVDIDVTASSYALTKHLINKGHKRIFFINGPSDYTQSLQRKKGSILALTESGIEINEDDFINMPIIEEAAYESLLNKGNKLNDYTAIVSFYDVFTNGILSFLKEKKLRIPADMALVTMGNNLISPLHSPALTSIDLVPYEMGYQAAEMLVDVIEKKRIQPSHTIISTKLVERESV